MKEKWRQLSAGLFDKTFLFCCEQLTQPPAPIMTSLNEHLCCLKTLGGQRQQKRGGRGVEWGSVCEISDILQTTTAFDEWLLLPERNKRGQMNDDFISCSHKESHLQPTYWLFSLLFVTTLGVFHWRCLSSLHPSSADIRSVKDCGQVCTWKRFRVLLVHFTKCFYT